MYIAESNRSISRTTFQQRQTVGQRPAAVAQRQTKQFAQNGSFDYDSFTEIVSLKLLLLIKYDRR